MPSVGPAELKLQSAPRRLALGYAAVASAWILLSDLLVASEGWPRWVQTIKGWLFVGVTATALFLLTRRLTRQLLALHGTLRRHADELEHRVEERTADLTAASRELDNFVHATSHDLRAPIRAVAGFAHALGEDYAGRLDETGRDYIRRIAGAADRMDSMVLDLRDYNRLARTALDLGPVALDSVVMAVRQLLQPDLDARRARLTVHAPLPGVLAHAETLTRMVTNLVDNALTFVAPGSSPDVSIRAETRGALVRLWIEDAGIGVPPEHAERIFRPFERLHAAATYPGTGLGLAIVRRGAERMGGAAGVEPAPGSGSRFWVDLPSQPIPGGPVP